MIHKNTRIQAIDNSGASAVRCIHVFKKGKNRATAFAGDLVRVSVERFRRSIPKKRVKIHQTIVALVVSDCGAFQRGNGLSLRGRGTNKCVILNRDQSGLLSNRLSGPVSIHLRGTKFSRIATIAPLLI